MLLPTLLLVAACSDDATNAVLVPPTGAVRIMHVDLDSTGTDLLVRVEVENGRSAPAFVITQPRRIAYRKEDVSLDLTLAEEQANDGGAAPEPIGCHYFAPAQTRLGSLSRQTFEFHLPRVARALGGSSEGDAPLEQSRQIRIAMAWSDVPLVPDTEVGSKCAREKRQNVEAKQRGLVTGVWAAR